MLTSYPIKINSVAIPFPETWSEKPQKVSHEFSMENGHRKKTEVRNNLLSISASFKVSSRWLKKFEIWRDMYTLTVSIYDAETGAYKDHTMEITDDSFSYNLVKDSKRMANTEGLWALSFELEEF